MRRFWRHQQRWRIVLLVILVIGGLLYLSLDPLLNRILGSQAPVVPDYPNRQDVQVQQTWRPWWRDRIITFHTTDSPEMIEAFYTRNLNLRTTRWHSAKYLGYLAYQTNPLFWFYADQYCPSTLVYLSWLPPEQGVTTVRLRIYEGECRNLPVTIIANYFVPQQAP